MNTPPIADARSFLFVPGNRPERFEKAVQSGAEAVILDLEDSVPAADKGSARAAIVDGWARLVALNVPLLVRTNAQDSPHWQEDLDALRSLIGLAGVMVPKAESTSTLEHVHQWLGGAAVVPLVESVAGLEALKSIATARGVLRLAVGHIDFMADAGLACGEDEGELVPLRFAVAMATRSARLASAIDGVTVQTSDDQRLRIDTQRARRFGFGAKLCIHPRQVAAVHETLAPTAAEVDWARRVIAADRESGGAAVQLDGRMVDRPVVLQAQRTLKRADGDHQACES